MRVCLIYGAFFHFVTDTIKWIESDIENEYWILSLGKNVYKNILNPDLKHIHIIEIKASEQNNWKDYYAILDELQDKYHFDKIVLITIYQEFENVKDNFKKIYEQTLVDHHKYFNKKIVIMKTKAVKVMTVSHLNLKYKLPIDHYLVDPPEIDLEKSGLKNVKKYYFYDNPRINAKHSSYIEYLIYDRQNEVREKTIDFVFGFSIGLFNRFWFWEYFKEMRNDIHKNNLIAEYYYKHIEIKEDDCSISKTQYIERLKHAKYSLIIPSYVDDEFSMIRFIENLSFGVIPLIFYRTDISRLSGMMDDFVSVIKRRGLIVNPYQISKVIKENRYEDLLDEFKKTDDWKRITDLGYLKSNFGE